MLQKCTTVPKFYVLFCFPANSSYTSLLTIVSTCCFFSFLILLIYQKILVKTDFVSFLILGESFSPSTIGIFINDLYDEVFCAGLNMNGPKAHVFECLVKKWHYLRGLGDVALLGEVCHWGWTLRVQKPKPGSVALSSCCLQFVCRTLSYSVSLLRNRTLTKAYLFLLGFS